MGMRLLKNLLNSSALFPQARASLAYVVSSGPMKVFMSNNTHERGFENGAFDSSGPIHNADHKENDNHHDNDYTKSSKPRSPSCAQPALHKIPC